MKNNKKGTAKSFLIAAIAAGGILTGVSSAAFAGPCSDGKKIFVLRDLKGAMERYVKKHPRVSCCGRSSSGIVVANGRQSKRITHGQCEASYPRHPRFNKR